MSIDTEKIRRRPVRLVVRLAYDSELAAYEKRMRRTRIVLGSLLLATGIIAVGLVLMGGP